MDSITHASPSVNFEDRKWIGALMINDSDSKHDRHIDIFVSDTVAFYFKALAYVVFSGCVSIFGIVTNVINIVVFVRQGIFKDDSSPSLLGLAVSDLCCVVSMTWMSISFSVTLWEPPGLSWDPYDIMYLTAGWPHVMCVQITRLVTAFVALERCICVVFPFKVKTLLTPKRSIIIISGLFIFCGLSYSYVFITKLLKWRTDPETNISRLVLVLSSSPHRLLVSDIMYFTNSFFNSGSVVVVFLSTMITISRVQLSEAWRKSMATGSSAKQGVPPLQNPNTSRSQTQQITDDQNMVSKQGGTTQTSNKSMKRSKMHKEIKLVRMIIVISIIFLICYLPYMTFVILNAINPEISFHGTYINLATAINSLNFSMETVNSSINIFIYYKMSSKYKQEFRVLFGLK